MLGGCRGSSAEGREASGLLNPEGFVKTEIPSCSEAIPELAFLLPQRGQVDGIPPPPTAQLQTRTQNQTLHSSLQVRKRFEALAKPSRAGEVFLPPRRSGCSLRRTPSAPLTPRQPSRPLPCPKGSGVQGSLTLLSLREPLRSTSSAGCDPPSAGGQSCRAQSASASPATSISPAAAGAEQDPGKGGGERTARGSEASAGSPSGASRSAAAAGTGLGRAARRGCTLLAPGPAPLPIPLPLPGYAQIFPSSFFSLSLSPWFCRQAQDWSRRDAGTGSHAFPGTQGLRGGMPRCSHHISAPTNSEFRWVRPDDLPTSSRTPLQLAEASVGMQRVGTHLTHVPGTPTLPLRSAQGGWRAEII